MLEKKYFLNMLDRFEKENHEFFIMPKEAKDALADILFNTYTFGFKDGFKTSVALFKGER